MKQPGRKSLAQLAIVPTSALAMLEPPESLTAPQVEVWKATVAARPADWFSSDTIPILVAYCKAVVEHDRVGALIDGFDTECLKLEDEDALRRYDKLIRLQDRIGKSVVLYARSMRLTQQSRIRENAAGARPLTKARPWVGDQ